MEDLQVVFAIVKLCLIGTIIALFFNIISDGIFRMGNLGHGRMQQMKTQSEYVQMENPNRMPYPTEIMDAMFEH